MEIRRQSICPSAISENAKNLLSEHSEDMYLGSASHVYLLLVLHLKDELQRSRCESYLAVIGAQ